MVVETQKGFFVYIPMTIVSEANCCEHWTKKAKRHRYQKDLVTYALTGQQIQVPCHIFLLRLGKNKMDEDNLITSLKYVRDAVSEYILPDSVKYYKASNGAIKKLHGRADDDPRLKWSYMQKKHSESAVFIKITFD